MLFLKHPMLLYDIPNIILTNLIILSYTLTYNIIDTNNP
jgi:hypothetical protein